MDVMVVAVLDRPAWRIIVGIAHSAVDRTKCSKREKIKNKNSDGFIQKSNCSFSKVFIRNNNLHCMKRKGNFLVMSS